VPLPFALPVALVLGASLAWLARVELARSEVPLVLARPFLVALSFAAFVFAPVVAYFVALHGDWAYVYVVPSARIPSAVDLLLVIVAGSLVPIGFAVAAPFAIARKGPTLLRASGVVLVVILALAAVTAKRLRVSASYAQYHGGFGWAPLAKTSLGRGVLLGWFALLAAYAWCARVLVGRRS
jgi:hypothetical protein